MELRDNLGSAAAPPGRLPAVVRVLVSLAPCGRVAAVGLIMPRATFPYLVRVVDREIAPLVVHMLDGLVEHATARGEHPIVDLDGTIAIATNAHTILGRSD